MLLTAKVDFFFVKKKKTFYFILYILISSLNVNKSQISEKNLLLYNERGL